MPVFSLPCRVNVCLSVLGGDTYGGIFEHAAEAAHRMALEMGQVNHEIIVLQMGSNDVVFYPFIIGDRNLEFTFFVHDIHIGYGFIPSFGDFLPVGFRRRTASLVSRIAFNQRTADLFHQITNQLGTEMV